MRFKNNAMGNISMSTVNVAGIFNGRTTFSNFAGLDNSKSYIL